ncbi:hypothetical protein ACIBCA_14580 [Kitasatospora sp. NPDC051170]|uniref:hypothetical protein n=1 Tax=Kitasatospora sp. NPDC051170 TaxID=3364056 RepID=UPI0037ADF942
MALPSWEDPKLGSMKRVALWLATVAGEGRIFTYTQLRDVFPGVAQIDRRVRDLRGRGWRIDTAREDTQLGMHELRLVSVGEPVWEDRKGPGKETSGLTGTRRREVLAKDGHICRSCGISVGEDYAGSFERSQLDIARREVRLPDGSTAVELITECRRCRVGASQLETDAAQTIAEISHLGSMELRMLDSWVKEDKREFGKVELLWAAYRTMPADSRERFRVALKSSLG